MKPYKQNFKIKEEINKEEVKRRYKSNPPGPSGREPLHNGPPPRCPHGPGFGLHLGLSPSNGTQGGGSVMMVYGLDHKVNCDKLFNLFCLYGNVSRINFLKTKEGCCMVQMGDTISVERCITNLNNISVGGNFKIQLGFSKQAYLNDVAQPYNLADNTQSFKDYTGNKNNRFINPSMASKNRILGPSTVLHFFNTPPSVTEEQLLEVISEKTEAKPNVQIFPMKGDRSSSGLLEFESVETALNAVMLCNHMPIKNPVLSAVIETNRFPDSTGKTVKRPRPGGKAPYNMKLSFSSTHYPVNLDKKDNNSISI